MSIADLVYLSSLAQKQASDEAYYDYVFQRAYTNKIANGGYYVDPSLKQGVNDLRNYASRAGTELNNAGRWIGNTASSLWSRAKNMASRAWNSTPARLGRGIARSADQAATGLVKTIGRNAWDASKAYDDTRRELARAGMGYAKAGLGEAMLGARKFGRRVAQGAADAYNTATDAAGRALYTTQRAGRAAGRALGQMGQNFSDDFNRTY